jgi:hypothetical protein
MHKGRGYRRILPPGFAHNMDFDTHSPPFRFFFSFRCTWNNIPIGFSNVKSDAPDIDLKRLLAVWRIQFSTGPETYNFFFDFSPVPKSPLMKFEVLCQDNYGGFLALDWRLMFPVVSWNQDTFFLPSPNNLAAGGFFAPFRPMLTWTPVRYNEE